jgi:3-oxoacyl-[acyl-carrier-protein] synthase III
MSAWVAGVGTWYPDNVRRNADWPSEFGRASLGGDRLFNDIPRAVDEASRITDEYLRAEASDAFLGVRERRVTPPSISAVDAEVWAAERALADARVRAADVDVLLSYSVVPERLTPATGCAVAHRLGASRALAFGMDAACATALVQLEVAANFVETGRADTVLLTQSHLLLRAFPMAHPAAPGLGDAATALVVRKTGRYEILATHAVTSGEYHDAVTWVRAAAEDTPWWLAGSDFRVGTRNREQAKDLQRDTVTSAARTLREVCQRAGVDAERLDLLASVEPRGWVPVATARVLGLSPEAVLSVYQTRGHLGACGPIANLALGQEQGLTHRAGLLGMYAQGAGFTRAAALLRMHAPLHSA